MAVTVRWTITYGSDDRVEARVVHEQGVVLDFSVQYLARIQERWYPVVRFDTAHGRPHMDVSNPDGTSFRINLAPGLGYREVFNTAVDDVSRNWRRYREEFERRMGHG